MAQLLGNKKKDDFSQLLGKTDNKNQGFDLRFRNTNSISYDSKIGLDNYSVPLLFRENQINTSTITRGIYADLNGIVSEYNTVIPDLNLLLHIFKNIMISLIHYGRLQNLHQIPINHQMKFQLKSDMEMILQI